MPQVGNLCSKRSITKNQQFSQSKFFKALTPQPLHKLDFARLWPMCDPQHKICVFFSSAAPCFGMGPPGYGSDEQSWKDHLHHSRVQTPGAGNLPGQVCCAVSINLPVRVCSAMSKNLPVRVCGTLSRSLPVRVCCGWVKIYPYKFVLRWVEIYPVKCVVWWVELRGTLQPTIVMQLRQAVRFRNARFRAHCSVTMLRGVIWKKNEVNFCVWFSLLWRPVPT